MTEERAIEDEPHGRRRTSTWQPSSSGGRPWSCAAQPTGVTWKEAAIEAAGDADAEARLKAAWDEWGEEAGYTGDRRPAVARDYPVFHRRRRRREARCTSRPWGTALGYGAGRPRPARSSGAGRIACGPVPGRGATKPQRLKTGIRRLEQRPNERGSRAAHSGTRPDPGSGSAPPVRPGPLPQAETRSRSAEAGDRKPATSGGQDGSLRPQRSSSGSEGGYGCGSD